MVNCVISMSGFWGIRVREPDVLFDAELPGRGGRTSDANGASSESSDDESELSSELLLRAFDFSRARSASVSINEVHLDLGLGNK